MFSSLSRLPRTQIRRGYPTLAKEVTSPIREMRNESVKTLQFSFLVAPALSCKNFKTCPDEVVNLVLGLPTVNNPSGLS